MGNYFVALALAAKDLLEIFRRQIITHLVTDCGIGGVYSLGLQGRSYDSALAVHKPE